MMAVKSNTKNEEAPRDPVRRWTLIVLGLIVILFLYSIIADRLTPYTSQATVQAFVVRMAPEVAGRWWRLLTRRRRGRRLGRGASCAKFSCRSRS